MAQFTATFHRYSLPTLYFWSLMSGLRACLFHLLFLCRDVLADEESVSSFHDFAVKSETDSLPINTNRHLAEEIYQVATSYFANTGSQDTTNLAGLEGCRLTQALVASRSFFLTTTKAASVASHTNCLWRQSFFRLNSSLYGNEPGGLCAGAWINTRLTTCGQGISHICMVGSIDCLLLSGRWQAHLDRVPTKWCINS